MQVQMSMHARVSTRASSGARTPAKAPPVVGGFFVACARNGRSYDDPIAKPNQPGASHRHDFFGARGVTARSTAAQLRRSRTSCGEPGDTAGYWHPTLLVEGRPVSGRINAYYDRGGLPTVQPFPRELKLLAGDPMAERAQPASRIGFECVRPDAQAGLAPVTRPSTAVPQCATGTQLAGRVVFPNCWNGHDLDSADHKSHMAFAKTGRCPASHPIAVPRLILVATWTVRPTPSTVALSSGVPSTWHADFWNTWNPVRLRRLVRNCVDQQRDCARVGTVPR
jgi:hypothetical protein